MLNTKLVANYALIIALVTIFTILGMDRGQYDLKISQILVNQGSVFGKFIAEYGELPGWITLFMAAMFLLLQSEKRKIMQNIILVVLVLAISTTSFLLRYGYYTILIFAVCVIISYFVFRYFERNNGLETLDYFSKSSILMGLIHPGIIVQLLKSIWGRVRYRDLSSVSEFTPWWHINGFTGDRSFPSGHTAMGIMLLPLIILIASWIRINITSGRNQKILENFALTILLIWAGLVGLGRIVIGAHYFSDVMFSILAGIVVYNYLSSKFDSSLK